jgi:hypothetical protein
MSYRFVWKVSYQHTAGYEVHGDGPRYLIEERREPSAYDLETYNGTMDQWNREVIGSVGTIHRLKEMTTPIPQAVVDAFNAWRLTEWERDVGAILADRRYDGIGRNDSIFKPPQKVKGAHWVPGTGWAIQHEASMERAA